MNFLRGIISYGDQRESLLHAQSSVIAEETALDTSVQCERKDSEAGACQLIFLAQNCGKVLGSVDGQDLNLLYILSFFPYSFSGLSLFTNICVHYRV